LDGKELQQLQFIGGLVMITASPPFGACTRCRVQCGYRGAAPATIGEPKALNKIKHTVAALEVKGLTGAAIESRWKQPVSRLHTGVGAFAALPLADPRRRDAAFCLFLHSLAIRTMRFSPSWPKSVATRLGIPATEATE
jgi:hypothetical protein